MTFNKVCRRRKIIPTKVPKAYLSEEPLTPAAGRCWVVNVNIVVFCTNGLFDKWLLENFPIDFYMIFSFNQTAFCKQNITARTVRNCSITQITSLQGQAKQNLLSKLLVKLCQASVATITGAGEAVQQQQQHDYQVQGLGSALTTLGKDYPIPNGQPSNHMHTITQRKTMAITPIL